MAGFSSAWQAVMALVTFAAFVVGFIAGRASATSPNPNQEDSPNVGR